MRFAICASAVLLAIASADAGPLQLVKSVGPWRIGVLHDRMDDIDTDIVSNVGDEYGTLTFAFRCRDGKYDSVIFKRDGQKLFEHGKSYDLEWRLDHGAKISGLGTGIVDAGLKMDIPVRIDDLFDKHELIVRVYTMDRKYDGVFPLDQAQVALGSMTAHCVSQ